MMRRGCCGGGLRAYWARRKRRRHAESGGEQDRKIAYPSGRRIARLCRIKTAAKEMTA